VNPSLGPLYPYSYNLFFMKTRKKQTKKPETDYKAFYSVGLVFIVVGLTLSIAINIGLLGMAAIGFIFMIKGLKNKDKWKK
jgi:uncharacterized membrane protein